MARYKRTEVDNFLGMFSNADLENTNRGSCRFLQNMKPDNGRLVQTKALSESVSTLYSFTDFFSSTQLGYITSLTEFVNDNLQIEDVSLDSIVLAVGVDSSTGLITIYVYDSVNGEWARATSPAQTVGGSDYLFTQPANLYALNQINSIMKSWNTFRIVPGNVAQVGSNDVTPIWVGWIDRSRFDENDTISPSFYIYNSRITDGSDYVSISLSKQFANDAVKSPIFTGTVIDANTVQFEQGSGLSSEDDYYNDDEVYSIDSALATGAGTLTITDYNGELKKITVSETITATYGTELRIRFPEIYAYAEDGDTTDYYYRYSLIYDGYQESLLSTNMAYISGVGVNEGVIASVAIDDSINYRVTGVNIYRSESRYGQYYRVQTIDLVRDPSDKVKSDTNAANCYGTIVIGDSNILTHDFDDTESYFFRLDFNDNGGDAGLYDLFIDDGAYSGLGLNTFVLDLEGPNDSEDNSRYGESDGYKYTWALYKGTPSSNTLVMSGEEAYWGRNCVLLDQEDDTGEIFLPGSTLRVEDADGNYSYSFVQEVNEVDDDYASSTYNMLRISHSPVTINRELTGGYDGEITDKAHDITSPISPYVLDISGTTYTYTFFDYALYEGATHSLAGEVSVDANGKYGLSYGGRMFLANVVVDPSDTNESHEDWVMYSEREQPDVIPASNAIRLGDSDGGEITGIVSIGDEIVISKKNSMYAINVRDIGNPNNWYIRKISHDIGNIADNGMAVIRGAIYVSYYDGIYKLTPNNLAESDRTPTKKLKISDPIQDAFDEYVEDDSDAMENIVPHYSPSEGVIHFHYYNSDGDVQDDWAYDLNTGEWRYVVDNGSPKVAKNSYISSDGHLSFFDVDGSGMIYQYRQGEAKVLYRSPIFRLSDERYEIIRNLWIRYKASFLSEAQQSSLSASASELNLKIFNADDTYDLYTGASTPLFTKALTETAAGSSYTHSLFGVRTRAKRVYFEITSGSTMLDDSELHGYGFSHTGG